jgi:hypothetical protein
MYYTTYSTIKFSYYLKLLGIIYMKKLIYLIFSIFFYSYLHGAYSIERNRNDEQNYFIAFIQKCNAGLYDKAIIQIDARSYTQYDVTFFVAESSNGVSTAKNCIKLPFENHKRKEKFSDLVCWVAGTQASTRSQTESFIKIMLGYQSGKIEFKNKFFSVQESA